MLNELIISCFTVLSYPGDGPPPKPPLLCAPTSLCAPAVAANCIPAESTDVDWSGSGTDFFPLSWRDARLPLDYRSGHARLGRWTGQRVYRSVLNLHGWADGDPFYVNYVGHPMQGAVAGRIWLLHDPRYRKAEFGRSRHLLEGQAARGRVRLGVQRAVRNRTAQRGLDRPHPARFSAAGLRRPRDHADHRTFLDARRGRAGSLCGAAASKTASPTRGSASLLAACSARREVSPT